MKPFQVATGLQIAGVPHQCRPVPKSHQFLPGWCDPKGCCGSPGGSQWLRKRCWEVMAATKWVFMEVGSWFWITVNGSLDAVDGIFVPRPEAEQQRRWARQDWPKSTERIPANSGISLSPGHIQCRVGIWGVSGHSKGLSSCPSPRAVELPGPPRIPGGTGGVPPLDRKSVV